MSHPRKIPDRSEPISTYPSLGESLIIPKRSGTKRTISQVWDRKYSDLDPDQLLLQRDQVGIALNKARKNLKRHSSVDAEYWIKYEEVARLIQENSQIESQKRLDDALQEKKEAKDWYESEDAQELRLRCNSWRQFSSIMEKHRKKLQDRLASSRESWVKLFTSSKLGFGLATREITMGAGARDGRDQKKFKKALIKAFCPTDAGLNWAWDPVMADWASDLIGAHLFPFAQGMFMDDIFGKGSIDELFAPVNGLLLTKKIKEALAMGVVAIVPDIELEPADPKLPLNDQKERCKRVKAWEKQEVKEYKLIVLNKTHPRATDVIFIQAKHGVSTIAELDGRRLKFRNNFRPRARYIWWTYLNAILKNSWAQKTNAGNMQHVEVRKCTRYWGSRACYVKQNQLLGFVEELGHDVESILEFDKDETAGEPGMEAVSALVGNAMLEAEGDEDDWEDVSDEEIDSD
ncbi:hypothetical protein FBULB1_4485 [Fusarium bulbicola]|nr:hypothetical protein FBULB1_4485 [Fusarium bulbicola]